MLITFKLEVELGDEQVKIGFSHENIKEINTSLPFPSPQKKIVLYSKKDLRQSKQWSTTC